MWQTEILFNSFLDYPFLFFILSFPLSQKEHSILHSWVRFSGFQNYSFTPGMNPSLLLCPSWIARNYGCEIVIIRWRIDNRYSKQSGQNFISFFYSESVLRLRNVSMKWSGARRRRGTKIQGWQKNGFVVRVVFFSPHTLHIRWYSYHTLLLSQLMWVITMHDITICSLYMTITPQKVFKLSAVFLIVSAKKLWDLQYPSLDIT